MLPGDREIVRGGARNADGFSAAIKIQTPADRALYLIGCIQIIGHAIIRARGGIGPAQGGIVVQMPYRSEAG